MLDVNEIKKALYREKPSAFLDNVSKEEDPVHTYEAWLENDTHLLFKIKESEMGENKFDKKEQAQLLIRWLVI
jgi:hypothetical protein